MLYLLLAMLLIVGCRPSTPSQGGERAVLPTANVPPISEVDAAISRWKNSQTLRYFVEVQESREGQTFQVRVVVADGQVRAAQRLELGEDGKWGEPFALPIPQAQDYTVDGVLERLRRDVLGIGPAPVNLRVVFDPALGFPQLVRAEVLPYYDQSGQYVLDRRFDYELTMEVKALLEDTFGVGRQPMFTLIRSGGPKAWCDVLRIFADRSSSYADDCRQIYLDLRLPERRMNKLLDLAQSFNNLDERRERENQFEQLTIVGTGEQPPDQATVQAAWELAENFAALLSQPVGRGLTLVFVRNGELFGFDVSSEIIQPSSLERRGQLRGAALNRDEKWLAFSDDEGLKVFDLEKATVTTLVAHPDGWHYLPRSWSPSGYLLVAQIPESEEDTPLLGWVSMEQRRWRLLPLAAGSKGYGCDSGAEWSPQSDVLAVTGLGVGLPCNINAGLTIVDVQAQSAQSLVVPLIASGMEGGGSLKAGAHTPAWSPDGQWIAFGLDQDAHLPLTFPTRLYRVRPDGTGLAPLTNNGRGTAIYPVWSNDGNLYYSLNGDMIRANGIYRFQIATNAHTLLIPGSDLQPVSLSPDGKFLVYQQGDGLYLWDFFLQEAVEVVPKQDGQQVQFVGWLDGRD